MVNLTPGENCRICQTKCQSFQTLNYAELGKLNEHRFRNSFRKGEVIFRENTPASNIVSVASGLVKISLEGYSSKKLILEILKGPILIGGPGMYVDNRYQFSLTALSNVDVCFIETNMFKQIVRNNGDFADNFISEFSHRAIQTYHKAISLTQKHMNGRLAEALLYFSDRIFDDKKFELPLSRQELADYTNMTKESACRILKKFKDDGIIDFNGNSFIITDLPRLKLTSENG